MNRASTVLAIIGYLFICTFAWKRYQLIGDDQDDQDASVERDAYKYIAEQVAVLQPSFWLKLAGVAMAKYFFTTLAGVDWMMVEIGKQRRYEILMEISQKIKALETSGKAVRYPHGLRTEVERLENLQAAEERLLRLDCVFYILYDEVPMHVVEEEDVNPQVPSMRRRTTVLAPAVSGLLADVGDVEMENLRPESDEKDAATPVVLPSPAQSYVDSDLAARPSSEPSRPQDVADAQRPSALDGAWSFFFGLRVPESRPQARSLTPRPGYGSRPPPPTTTFPNSPTWGPQAPPDWAQQGGGSQHPHPGHPPFSAYPQGLQQPFAGADARHLLPPQWQTSLAPRSDSSGATPWARHTMAPGQQLRPHF